MKKKLTLLSLKDIEAEGGFKSFFASAVLADEIFVLFRAQGSANGFERWLDWILFAVVIIGWPILTIRRLRDLHLSWAWFLPVGLCYAVEWAAASQGRNWVAFIAASFALLVQLPFVFLSSGKRADTMGTPPSGQSNP